MSVGVRIYIELDEGELSSLHSGSKVKKQLVKGITLILVMKEQQDGHTSSREAATKRTSATAKKNARPHLVSVVPEEVQSERSKDSRVLLPPESEKTG